MKVGVVSQGESVAVPLTVHEMVGMGRYPHLSALGAERDEDRAAVQIHDRVDLTRVLAE